MADAELRDLTEKTSLVATDHLAVQDNASGALQRIDALNAKTYFADGALDLNVTSAANTRFDLPTNASRQWAVTMGPYLDMQNTIQAVSSGMLALGLTMVRGGLFEEFYIDIETAGSAGDDAYYVIYDVGADGMPETLLTSIGPFNIETSTGAVGVVETETLTAGMRWAGIFCPTANTGSPVFEGGRGALLVGHGANTGTQMRQTLLSGDTTLATPPADISAYTIGSSTGATKFTGTANGFAHLTGKENV